MLERLAAVTLIGVLGSASHAGTFIFDPNANYFSVNDSPLKNDPGFVYEDFEDGALNTLGISEVSGNGRIVGFPAFGTIVDSVDGDDGTIDGFGRGWSMDDAKSHAFGGRRLRFAFDAVQIGSAPTRAGLVWTDGGNGNITLTFEAFDLGGLSLGTVVYNTIDNNFHGETAEDRFFGIEHADGVSAIEIRYSSNIFEVDHIQYSLFDFGPVIPLPQTAPMGLAGLALLATRRRRSHAR